MPQNKTIVLTGGGTAGHVTPNLALLPYLEAAGYRVCYFGSKKGIERKLLSDYPIPYTAISTGKLRRYFDLKNFTDPFRVIGGFVEARRALKKLRPSLVFSKGGFVSVPVVRAAWSLGIPCIIHESDMTPGLANRLCYGAAARILCNFPETLQSLPEGKAVLTGTPIRDSLFSGDREKGLALCGFTGDRPVLMVMGGSQGAASVNKAVRDHLDGLLKDFQIVHLCGQGHLDPALEGRPGYRQFEYVRDDLRHLFAAADLILSRSGANAICEILALRIPNILVPLSAGSRGDQVLNAASFRDRGFSEVVPNDELGGRIEETVRKVWQNRASYRAAMEESGQTEAIPLIMDLIAEVIAESGQKKKK